MTATSHLEERIFQMKPLIIIGMHRSGTSLMVRLLSDLGIHFGYCLSRDAESIFFQKINRRIYASVDNNWANINKLLESMNDEDFISRQTEIIAKILFPRRRIKINQGISHYFGRKIWAEVNQNQMVLWGWKDPRASITFPIWLRIFPNARVLHVLRNGIDVAISLHRRSQKQRQKIWKRIIRLDYAPETLSFKYCFHLWEKYISFILTNEHLIPSGQYLEIKYEELLANGKEKIKEVVDFIEFPIANEKLDVVCKQINSNRLNNKKYAKPYQEEISSLASNQLMQKLQYNYSLDENL